MYDEAENRRSSPTSGSKPSVLIIDDHQGTLDSYSTLLRLAGFETATASSGRAGIDLALSRRFDVVLVDLRLPDISGVDVVRALRRGRVGTPIVIVTAFPALESSFDAGSAGANGYVDGPLFGDEVIAVVAQSLKGPFPVRHPSLDGIEPGQSRARGVTIDSRVNAVKQMIDADLDQSASIGDFADRVGWSKSSLSHRFRAEVGMSIAEYRTGRRLQEASRRLVTMHEPIGRIAKTLGYRSSSLADFRRDFRKRFGMSPKEYRARFWRRLRMR